MNTESVKIKTEVLNRVRDYAKNSGYNISGFINTSLTHVLNELDELDKIESIKSRQKKKK